MKNLTLREKQIVTGGSILALIFICIQFIFMPAYDKNASLEQTLAAEQRALQQITVLQKEYKAMAVDNSSTETLLKTRPKGFTLFSYLDRQASQSGVKTQIDYMKPQSRELENQPYTLAVVKLKLKKLTLKEFVRFINKVESSQKGIHIASLSLTKSGKDGKHLDAVLEAQTIMPKGGSA